MLLKIKNIAMIDSADIDINGITVIAGENNTGKSTIGKILFCMVNAFYKIDKQVYNERISSIVRVLDNFYHNKTNRLTRRFEYRDFSKKLIDKATDFIKNKEILKDTLDNFFAEKITNYQRNDSLLEDLNLQILNRLSVPDYEVKKAVLRRYLQTEFDMQINHSNDYESTGYVSLFINNEEVKITVKKNEEITINDHIIINSEAIYIDDPFVLDNLSVNYYYVNNHKWKLKDKLKSRFFEPSEKDIFDEVVNKNKLNNIINKINMASEGEICSLSDGEVAFREKGLKEPITLANLSSGLKTFVIIKILLLNSDLNQNGILILDEPEIHLHPEWQLLFAEIIVLLQKEFNMNILINTHSPYFLNAIEVYAARNSIGDKCKYYLADAKEKHSTIYDVTNDIEKIYRKLSRPLQILENEKYLDE